VLHQGGVYSVCLYCVLESLLGMTIIRHLLDRYTYLCLHLCSYSSHNRSDSAVTHQVRLMDKNIGENPSVFKKIRKNRPASVFLGSPKIDRFGLLF
jgi:hypothetical protein